MRRNRIRSALVVATALLLGPAVGAGPAAAGPPGTPGGTRVYAELVRVGVDHEIAEANGYQVYVDRHGVEYAVAKGSPPSIDGTVSGNCGTSWVDWDLIDRLRHKANIFTGFTILAGLPDAVSVPTWQTTVIDNYGTSTREHGPLFDVIAPTDYWAGKYLEFRAGGPTGASVHINFGTAVLANGTICFAGAPWDYADL